MHQHAFFYYKKTAHDERVFGVLFPGSEHQQYFKNEPNEE